MCGGNAGGVGGGGGGGGCTHGSCLKRAKTGTEHGGYHRRCKHDGCSKAARSGKLYCTLCQREQLDDGGARGAGSGANRNVTGISDGKSCGPLSLHSIASIPHTNHEWGVDPICAVGVQGVWWEAEAEAARLPSAAASLAPPNHRCREAAPHPVRVRELPH
jgi:hypothetical protein